MTLMISIDLFFSGIAVSMVIVLFIFETYDSKKKELEFDMLKFKGDMMIDYHFLAVDYKRLSQRLLELENQEYEVECKINLIPKKKGKVINTDEKHDVNAFTKISDYDLNTFMDGYDAGMEVNSNK